jgi:signal transduction histidine kinase
VVPFGDDAGDHDGAMNGTGPADGLPRPTPRQGAQRPQEAWASWIVGWHLAFWLLMALVVLRLAIAGDLNAGKRMGGLAVAAVLSLAYLLTVHLAWAGGGYELAHRRTGKAQTPGHDTIGYDTIGHGQAGYVYLCLAVVGTGVACAIDVSLSMLLFIVYPQTWMLSRSRRGGVAFTTALTASTTAGFFAQFGWSLKVLRNLGPQMLVSLLFSLLLGMWIWRVIEQSGERAGLITALEATRSELAVADHARGVLAERERMAREIHDTLAQGFTSIVMLAQAAQAGLAAHPGRPERAAGQLAAIEDVARENLAEARALVSAYTPVGLDGSTLTDAVRRLVERFGRETGLHVELQVGDGVAGLSRAQEVVALRAAQEALTNVRRHARAQRVTVRLEADEQGTRVEVGDDGVGFRPAPQAPAPGAPVTAPPSRRDTSPDTSPDTAADAVPDAAPDAVPDAVRDLGRPGFGLAGIRSRVSEVGGRLDVASSPGGGTRVTVLLPRESESESGHTHGDTHGDRDRHEDEGEEAG